MKVISLVHRLDFNYFILAIQLLPSCVVVYGLVQISKIREPKNCLSSDRTKRMNYTEHSRFNSKRLSLGSSHGTFIIRELFTYLYLLT